MNISVECSTWGLEKAYQKRVIGYEKKNTNYEMVGKKKGGEDTPINLGMQWQEMVVGT